MDQCPELVSPPQRRSPDTWLEYQELSATWLRREVRKLKKEWKKQNKVFKIKKYKNEKNCLSNKKKRREQANQ